MEIERIFWDLNTGKQDAKEVLLAKQYNALEKLNEHIQENFIENSDIDKQAYGVELIRVNISLMLKIAKEIFK